MLRPLWLFHNYCNHPDGLVVVRPAAGKAGKLLACHPHSTLAPLPAARSPTRSCAGPGARHTHRHPSADRHDRLHGPAGLLRHHPGEGGGGGDCEGEAGGGGDGGGTRARRVGAGGFGWTEGARSAAGHAALGRKPEFSGELIRSPASDKADKLISIILMSLDLAIRK